MPPPLPLTSERLERHGLFLIEDGQTLFLWVGRDAVPQLVIDVFDLPNYETLRGGKVSPPACSNLRTIQLTLLESRPHCHSLTILSRSA
jgi:protein transport protein SEC24